MAMTPTPLVWDCWREVQGAAELGGVIHYDDEESQQLYLDGALQTRVAAVPEGHWADAQPGEEITLDDTAYGATAWDHPSVGALYGCGDEGDKLWFFRYSYAFELSALVKTGTWKARNDSQVTQLSLTLYNPGEDMFTTEGSVLHPGCRLTVAITMGDSAPYQIGVVYLDELIYNRAAPTVPLSGRNAIGYRLLDQTFDEHTEWSGPGDEIVAEILQLAGVHKFIINDAANCTWTFKPDQSIYDGIEDIKKYFVGWDMIELPDGTIVIGYPATLQLYQRNGVYVFGEGEIVKRSTSQSADGAYARVHVKGKAADGSELEAYEDVPCWTYWELGAHKTLHLSAEGVFTQESLQAYAEQQARELQYIGIGETFDGPIRPYLLVGDVASILDGEGVSVDLGLITSVTHTFGESGFFTSFTVDSGGVIQDGESYIVTRSADVSGYNRQMSVSDLIGIISNKK